MGNSIFEGAMNDSSFKNKGTSPTGSTINNGEPGYQKRTVSPRVPEQVTKTTNDRYIKPTKQ